MQHFEPHPHLCPHGAGAKAQSCDFKAGRSLDTHEHPPPIIRCMLAEIEIENGDV